MNSNWETGNDTLTHQNDDDLIPCVGETTGMIRTCRCAIRQGRNWDDWTSQGEVGCGSFLRQRNNHTYRSVITIIRTDPQ